MDRPWRLARCLEQLRAEIDVVWPVRSTASDGTIGDLAHKRTHSDHNVNEYGVVRAWDITHDPVHGPPLGLLALFLVGFGIRGSDRMQRGAYVIYNGKIWSYRSGWEVRPYSGVNPHTSHLHISAPEEAAFYDIGRPWGLRRALNG